jgi:host factor-I protein
VAHAKIKETTMIPKADRDRYLDSIRLKQNIINTQKYYDRLIETETDVTVFLMNGVKLQGVIVGYSLEADVYLYRDSHLQEIKKTAISTVMPAKTMDIYLPYNCQEERQAG